MVEALLGSFSRRTKEQVKLQDKVNCKRVTKVRQCGFSVVAEVEARDSWRKWESSGMYQLREQLQQEALWSCGDEYRFRTHTV